MNRNDSGFSLMETLVAFTVLSLVLLSAMEVFGDGTKRVVLAQQQMSEFSRLQNAMALMTSGVDRSTIDKNIRVEVIEVEKESFASSGLRPFLLEVSNGSGDDAASIKTIVLRRQ